MNPILRKSLVDYRKERFAVQVEKERHPMDRDEVVLKLTKDGNNWNCINLLQCEIPQVIAALKAAIKKP